MQRTKYFFLASLMAGITGTAGAGIVVHGSTTAYTSNDGDWLTHTTNDIDNNGLGTDGFVFFGDFDGDDEFGQAFSHRVTSAPTYVTAFNTGADFVNAAGEFAGYGSIDDPTQLDGTNALSGVAAATGGTAGDSLEVVTFTVSGLTNTVRVGILAGNEGNTDGRWQPTSITLSEGTNSATVGNHTTSPLTNNPGDVNIGWVFFDIDADGTYAVSGTKRLNTQGVTIGGLTFDSVPEPSSLALLGLGGLLICHRRRAK